MPYTRSNTALAIADSAREFIRSQIAPYQHIVPVPIEQIAVDWGVVVFSPLWEVDYLGLSAWKQGRHYVAINGQKPYVSQRFTLAHETVGHGLLHRDKLTSATWDNWVANASRWALEIEANTAAAEFLLPFEWLRDQMTSRFGERPLAREAFVQWIQSRDAQELANQAQVSRAVIGHHICDLQWAEPGSRERWLGAGTPKARPRSLERPPYVNRDWSYAPNLGPL